MCGDVAAYGVRCRAAVVCAIRTFAVFHGLPLPDVVDGEPGWDEATAADFLTCTLEYLARRDLDLAAVLARVERDVNAEIGNLIGLRIDPQVHDRACR